jgi:excisionase family DNA binding protein
MYNKHIAGGGDPDKVANPPESIAAPTPLAYGIKDACRAASVSRGMIYSEIRAGRLKKVKLGRRTLILVEDLKAWLAANRGVAA